MPDSYRVNDKHQPTRQSQHGAAFIVMLVILVVGIAAMLVDAFGNASLQIERDKTTSSALAHAKEALIGYASSGNLFSSSDRPGDLPCPDIDNDGSQDTPCGNASGSSGQALRLGRLPWKTLGLPDLRDGNGERLWYAVSNSFKQQTKTTCTNSDQSGCLNSDTTGTITVYGTDGNAINTAGTNSGAVVVIFSPGAALRRQDSVVQNRGCTVGTDCDVNEKCTSTPATNTPKCDPINYLDIATVNANTRDNRRFTDGLTTDGFIQGRILDSEGRTILNDQLLVITKQQIIPLLEKRVAAEVRNCLTEYAAMPDNQGPPPNQGYFPWATARTVGATVAYNDSDRLEFGHIPDQPFSRTCNDTGGATCGTTGGMHDTWGASCTLTNSNWWVNWKEMVFYGFAHSFRPHNLTHDHACSNSTCLVVNPPSTAVDKSFVVIVAGEKLPGLGQVRANNTDKANFSNYLENTATPFAQSAVSSTFNDTVVYE